jgi:hypothetical protein
MRRFGMMVTAAPLAKLTEDFIDTFTEYSASLAERPLAAPALFELPAEIAGGESCLSSETAEGFCRTY